MRRRRVACMRSRVAAYDSPSCGHRPLAPSDPAPASSASSAARARASSPTRSQRARRLSCRSPVRSIEAGRDQDLDLAGDGRDRLAQLHRQVLDRGRAAAHARDDPQPVGVHERPEAGQQVRIHAASVGGGSRRSGTLRADAPERPAPRRPPAPRPRHAPGSGPGRRDPRVGDPGVHRQPDVLAPPPDPPPRAAGLPRPPHGGRDHPARDPRPLPRQPRRTGSGRLRPLGRDPRPTSWASPRPGTRSWSTSISGRIAAPGSRRASRGSRRACAGCSTSVDWDRRWRDAGARERRRRRVGDRGHGRGDRTDRGGRGGRRGGAGAIRLLPRRRPPVGRRVRDGRSAGGGRPDRRVRRRRRPGAAADGPPQRLAVGARLADGPARAPRGGPHRGRRAAPGAHPSRAR